MIESRMKGYITCYLALTLGIMLSLIFTLFEAVRIRTIRTETEGVMDLSLFSVFGEFHREMLEQYDLFFVDTSYGEGTAQVKRCEEHLQYYMNENFSKDGLTELIGFRDLTGLHCDNVEFTNYMYASDGQGQVLMYQIMKYMQNKTGLDQIEKVLSGFENIEENGISLEDMDSEWEESEGRLAQLVEERKEQLQVSQTEEDTPIGFDNPVSQISQIKAQGVLGLALPGNKQISSMEITPEYYCSQRKLASGKGSLKISDQGWQMTKKALLEKYLLEKCSSYEKPLEKAVLKYQIEYILHGKSGDMENLEATAEDILRIRQGINFAYLLTDSAKLEEADAMATVLSAVLLSPEIKEVLKVTILFAWNYAESVKDVRILLDGNKLPLWKNEESWNTPLIQLLSFTSHLGEYESAAEGNSYQDYLVFLLAAEETKDILCRFMDICEMDIRVTEGNQYFQMDGCLYGIRAKANVSSDYGYGCEITREYIYE